MSSVILSFIGKCSCPTLEGLLAQLNAGYRRAVLGNPGSWLRLARAFLSRSPTSPR